MNEMETNNRDYRDYRNDYRDYRNDYRDYRDYREDYRRDYDRRGGRINNRNYREQDFYEELEPALHEMRELSRKLEDIAEMSKNPQERGTIQKVAQATKDHYQSLKQVIEG